MACKWGQGSTPRFSTPGWKLYQAQTLVGCFLILQLLVWRIISSAALACSLVAMLVVLFVWVRSEPLGTWPRAWESLFFSMVEVSPVHMSEWGVGGIRSVGDARLGQEHAMTAFSWADTPSLLHPWECPHFTWRIVLPNCCLSFGVTSVDWLTYVRISILGKSSSIKKPAWWRRAPFEQTPSKTLLWFIISQYIALNSGSCCCSGLNSGLLVTSFQVLLKYQCVNWLQNWQYKLESALLLYPRTWWWKSQRNSWIWQKDPLKPKNSATAFCNQCVSQKQWD